MNKDMTYCCDNTCQRHELCARYYRNGENETLSFFMGSPRVGDECEWFILIDEVTIREKSNGRRNIN